MKMNRLGPALAAVGLLALLAAVFVQGRDDAGAQPSPTLVRAEAIELVDGSGQVRAQLNVEPGGQVVFRLRDQNGTIRTKLGADTAGSGLLLNNERTEPGVHILATRRRTQLTLRRGSERNVLRP